MIDHINRTRQDHVVTLEDPIEIVHEDKGCIVSQREIGLDTPTFHEASPPGSAPGSGHHPDR